MTQQTAVKWYDDQLRKYLDGTSEFEWTELFSKAEQMEKNKIIDFAYKYADAVIDGYQGGSEQYYNETYGK